MSHWNVQPHVSINEVACYQTERRHGWSAADPVTAFIRINLGLKVLIKLTSERALMECRGFRNIIRSTPSVSPS